MLGPAKLHPEDVKAEIRKRYGSLAEFERRNGFPPLSARDVLRGKSRSKIAKAIADAIDMDVTELEVFKKSHNRDSNEYVTPAHRKSAGAR